MRFAGFDGRFVYRRHILAYENFDMTAVVNVAPQVTAANPARIAVAEPKPATMRGYPPLREDAA